MRGREGGRVWKKGGRKRGSKLKEEWKKEGMGKGSSKD